MEVKSYTLTLHTSNTPTPTPTPTTSSFKKDFKFFALRSLVILIKAGSASHFPSPHPIWMTYSSTGKKQCPRLRTITQKAK